MKRRYAFTLVELLISIAITGIVMVSVVTLFFSVFKSYELHQDITEAKQRGQIALAAIQPFVLNAGVGLPPYENDAGVSFQKAFSGLSILVDPKFTSFVQLAANADTTTANTSAPALWLVYSVPSGAGVNEEVSITATPKQVQIENFSSLSHSTNLKITRSELKAWVSFPSTNLPFYVSEILNGTSILTLQHFSSGTQRIAMFDEVHFIRAAKIYVDSAKKQLIINRLDDSKPQAVIDGIVGMWCTFTPGDDRVLTVRVLARASTKRGGTLQGVIEGWPSDALPSGAGLDRSYRYAVVSRSWRIRN